MMIRNKQLNTKKARRRVQMRSALLLTLGVCFVTGALRLLAAVGAMDHTPYALRWLMESSITLLAFGGCAYLGLCVMDGDHRKIVPMRRLSPAQLLWLSLLGVLAVCPALLMQDMVLALMGKMQAADGAQALSAPHFLTTLVKSVLLAPVCEELFFRGYLLQALERCGRLRASVIVSLCFALAHGVLPQQLAAYTLLGLLLCWMTLHTQSLLSAVLVHAAYNLALIALQGLGLAGLFTGWSLAACAVRLTGCALFAAVLKRAYTARKERSVFTLWEGEKLTRKETVLLCAAAVLLLAALVMGG